MYPLDTPHYRTSDHQSRHIERTIGYGRPFAAEVLAAEGRQRDARVWAEVWRATHRTQPGRWRGWLGALLIRVGTRVRGVESGFPAEMVQEFRRS